MKCPLIDNYQGSHNAFMFKSPLSSKVVKYTNHKQNILGSENVVIYELLRENYKLYNPCKSLKIVHEHKSENRNYPGERINRGDINVDGIYSVRNGLCYPI